MAKRLEWGRGNSKAVASVEELDALIDELAEAAVSQPYFVELIAESGAALSIGIGRSVSVASFVSPSGDPPYFGSHGKDDDDGEDLVFFYGGVWSDFPPSAGIPVLDAREAMRRFFDSGVLPENIRWREV